MDYGPWSGLEAWRLESLSTQNESRRLQLVITYFFNVIRAAEHLRHLVEKK